MSHTIITEIDSSSSEEFGSPRPEGALTDPSDSEASESYRDAVETVPVEREPTSKTQPEKLAPGNPESPPLTADRKLPAVGESTSAPTVHGDTQKNEAGPSAEDKEKVRQAEELKAEGNQLYGAGQHREALQKYQQALDTSPENACQQRAVYLANSAACHLKLEEFTEAAKECSSALALQPPTSLQIKALTRRGQAYEKLDDLERAMADYEKLLELDQSNSMARGTVRRLKPIVEERREKMKDEMIGKLKELGNTVLGKFGMSLDNFKAEKDPQTGAYSINFKQ